MTLERFLDVIDAPERSLVVVNRTEPEPFQAMLEKLFDDQPVPVSEGQSETYDENTVLLLEDGDVVATSPLEELSTAILLVNSDLFITGARRLEGTEVPDVLDGLAGTRFSLRGYPESNSEKLLLVLISRHIEKRAYTDGTGELRSSFQRLSRVNDERGTRRVYERVAETDVDVHLYGQPDWTPSPECPVTIHGGYSYDFRNSWFVIHCPAADSETKPAALLALELDDGKWDGFWTYDDQPIGELVEYVQTTM